MNLYQKIVSIIFLSCLLMQSSIAQDVLPDYIIHKVKDGEVFVRWEPTTPEDWRMAISSGYTIEILQKKAGSKDFEAFRKESIKPAPFGDWDKHIEGVDASLADYYNGSRDVLYMNMEDAYDSVGEILEGGDQESTLDSFMLTLLTYSASYDFKITELSGLGYKFPFEKGKEYQVFIYPTTKGKASAKYITVDPAKYENPKTPQLKAEFGDKRVELKWKTRDHREIFLGYNVEFSFDNKSFSTQNLTPFINMYDDTPIEDERHFLEFKDSLPKNYETYWYRLKGIDFFGDQSILASTISGYGFDKIRGIPIIHFSEQTTNNEGYIKWRMDQKQDRLIKEYQVLRSDSKAGEYEMVLDKIPFNAREVKIKMKHTSNHFKISAVPKDGKPVNSLSVFIMGMDTIPPAVPVLLDSQIDSLGQVTLEWQANTESDLWGYKVFRGNFRNEEFSTLTPKPVRDTVFLDTINIQTMTDSIYYTILAADKRYNRSPYTSIIALPKPDLYPPVAPVIKDVVFKEDSIKIIWDNSSSRDVVRHVLYKKAVDLEDSWTLIAEVDLNGETIDQYYDKEFKPDTKYAYLITAMDDADLVSDPSKPYTVHTKSIKPKQAFEDINVMVDKKTKTATINWELKDPKAIKELIIYKGPSKEKVSMWKIVEPFPKSIKLDNLNKKKPIFLYISPVYEKGDLSKFSDLIIVEL